MINGKDNKQAFLIHDEVLTYLDLKTRIAHYAALFGSKTNNRIAIFSENRLEWVLAFYACWQTGNVPVPIDYLAGIDDVSFILNDCQPAVVFVSPDRQKVYDESLEQVKYSPEVIVFGRETFSGETNPTISTSQTDVNKTAVIIYTSGTTGSPKGVMLSFQNIIANIEGVTTKVDVLRPTDRYMMLLPLHHVFPLLGTMIIPFYSGATVAFCPSLNADDIIKTLQKHKVTVIIGVPRLYNLIRKGIVDKINQSGAARVLFSLAKKLKSKAFSRKIFKAVHQKFGGSLRVMVAGGAALDPEVAIDYHALGFEILEGYGMTEAAPMITFTRIKRFKPGSAGEVLPGGKIEIRDGEIVYSGPNVMQGYYEREGETNDILRDGWLYTGDLGRLEPDGRLYITGRKKEIIVLSNGKNINPAEIEAKIENSSPYVKEAAVCLQKENLCLVIVPDSAAMRRDGIEDEKEFLKREVLKPYNARAAQSKHIARLLVMQEELPKTRLGKIQRFKLDDYISDSVKTEKRSHEAVDSPELQAIIDFIAQQIGQEVYPDDRLADDLALDSLSRITLIVYLENTFGLNLPEENLTRFERVRDLADHIRAYKTRHKHEIVNWTHILKEKIHFKVPKAGISFNFTNWTYRFLVKSFLRLRVKGLENIPEGPCIIAPNHQSFLDGFVVASAIQRKVMRETYFYAKEKHWKSAFKRFMARKNNVILMDINKDLKLSLQKMAEVLRTNKKLIIFPEGTRTSDGQMGDFKQTFAILACELKVPVIPVAISGSYDALPAGKSFPRLFRKVKVSFLPTVNPENLSYKEVMEKVQALVFGQLNSAKA